MSKFKELAIFRPVHSSEAVMETQTQKANTKAMRPHGGSQREAGLLQHSLTCQEKPNSDHHPTTTAMAFHGN